MRLLGLTLVLLMMGSVQPAHAQASWSGWLTSGEYQAYFNAKLNQRHYPARVQMAVIYGQVRYRGFFQRIPGGMQFVSHHGFSDSRFAARNRQLLNQGYTRASRHRIVFQGRGLNMGTWVRF